jgi:hypothetical protein
VHLAAIHEVSDSPVIATIADDDGHRTAPFRLPVMPFYAATSTFYGMSFQYASYVWVKSKTRSPDMRGGKV